jgi:hypothetical protein
MKPHEALAKYAEDFGLPVEEFRATVGWFVQPDQITDETRIIRHPYHEYRYAYGYNLQYRGSVYLRYFACLSPVRLNPNETVKVFRGAYISTIKTLVLYDPNAK